MPITPSGFAMPQDDENAVKPEAVNHPQHYGGDNPYEVIKVLRAWFPDGIPFNIGNTIKYLARAGKKDPAKLVEDLEKGRWYLDDEIVHLKKHLP